MTPQRRIAIVDDNASVRTFVSGLLTAKNYDIVFQAEDGIDCTDQLGQAPILPELIITDIEMPRRNGFETVPIIKSRWPFIKIIAISSWDDKASTEKILHAGADSFLSKERNFHLELIPIISKLLDNNS